MKTNGFFLSVDWNLSESHLIEEKKEKKIYIHDMWRLTFKSLPICKYKSFGIWLLYQDVHQKPSHCWLQIINKQSNDIDKRIYELNCMSLVCVFIWFEIHLVLLSMVPWLSLWVLGFLFGCAEYSFNHSLECLTEKKPYQPMFNTLSFVIKSIKTLRIRNSYGHLMPSEYVNTNTRSERRNEWKNLGW